MASSASSRPVTTLLETCKDACDEIQELVQAVYAQLNKEPGAAVLKADKSFFSLADGVVQARPLARPRRPQRPIAHRVPGDLIHFDERC